MQPHDPCNRDDTTPGHRYDPLQCWLWNLNILLPDETVKKGLTTIHVKDLVCSRFRVASITSEVVPGEEPSIEINISEISGICTGKYASLEMAGDLSATAQLRPNHAMHLVTSFQSTLRQNYSMAISAKCTSCFADIDITELKFSGSFSAKLIDMFSGIIKKKVSKSLSGEVCDMIRPELEEYLDDSLEKADGFMLALIQNYTDAKETIPKSLEQGGDAVGWRDLWAVGDLLKISNRFINRFLNVGIVPSLFPELPEFLGEEYSCDGFFTTGINGLLHELTNGTGELSLNLPSSFNHTIAFPSYGNVTIGITDFTLAGLDAFRNLTLAKPFEENLMVSNITSTKGFNITVGASVLVEPYGNAKGGKLQEFFHVQFQTKRVSFLPVVNVVLDRKKLGRVRVGDLFSSNPFPCLLSLLDGWNVTHLGLEAEIDAVHFTADSVDDYTSRELEIELDRVIENAVNLFLERYPSFVSDAFYGLVQGPVLTQVNDFLKIISKFRGDCSSTEVPNTTDFVEFDENPIYRALSEWVNSEATLFQINRFLDCTSSYLQGLSPQVLYSLDLAGFRIDAREAHFENLASVLDLNLMKPEKDHYHLLNSLRIHPPLRNPNPIHSSLILEVNNSDLKFNSTIRLSSSITDFHASSSTLLEYDLNQLSYFKLSQVLNNSMCIIAPASTLRILNATSSMGLLNASVKIASSYKNKHTGQNWTFDQNYQDTLDLFFSKSNDVLMQYSNHVLSEKLRYLPEVCSGRPVPDDNSGEGGGGSGMGTFWVCFVLLCLSLCVFFIHRWRKKKQANNKNEADEQEMEEMVEPLLDWDYDALLDYVHPQKDSTTSSASSSEDHGIVSVPKYHLQHPLFRLMPLPISYIVLTCIAGNIALFISSNVNVGATTDLVVRGSAGLEIRFPPLFSFSLANTLRDMYRAGVYALFLIVLIFSGIWPYAKLLLMLFASLSPTKLLSIDRRESLLEILDALGKFSLVDSYFLILMMVAFRYHLELMDVVTIDVYVTPKYGAYSFLFATLISLVLGHVILHFHRRATQRPRFDTDTRKESLRQHIYKIGNQGVYLTRTMQRIVIFLFFATSTLLLIGIFQKSIHFEIQGLAGEMIGDASIESYSLVSLGSSISSSVEDPSDFGIRLLEVSYYFFGLVMPTASLCSTAALFFLPMTPKNQNQTLVFAEIANAWSTLEVFVISIVASVLQISRFAEFIVGDKCDFMESSPYEGTCYDVKAELGADSWILFTGVALNCILTSLVLRLGHAAQREHCDASNIKFDRIDDSNSKLTISDYQWLKARLAKTSCLRNWFCCNKTDHAMTQPLLHSDDNILQQAIAEDNSWHDAVSDENSCSSLTFTDEFYIHR